MRIINANGVDVNDYQLEVTAQKLSIKFTGVTDVIAEAALIDFSAQIQADDIGTIPNVNKISLLTIMEIAAANQGSVILDEAAKTIEGSIELSNAGALALGRDVMMLTFKGLQVGQKLEINTIDNFNLTNEYITYEPVHFNADVAKEIDVSKAYQLAIPKVGFDFVELKVLVDAQTTRTVRYTPDEIANITNEINELCFLVRDGATASGDKMHKVVTGSSRYYNLPIANVLTAKVSLTEDARIYLVSNSYLRF